MWINWNSFIIVLWIFFCRFFMNLRAEWNLIIFGILAIIFGFASYKSWQGIVNGIAGIWLFLSGIWFIIIGPANFIITGIIKAILGRWSALVDNPQATVSHKTT